jgi:hypothetical protein
MNFTVTKIWVLEVVSGLKVREINRVVLPGRERSYFDIFRIASSC